MIIIPLFCLSCAGKQGGVSIVFASTKTYLPISFNVFYDDAYFSSPASEYNPSLATASCLMALSGFASSTGNYLHHKDNIEDFFANLGFESIEANSYYSLKPSLDSFGVAIGNKRLGDSTLLAVSVRGGGYETEWASNVSLGEEGDFATGFKHASDIYLDFLSEYIQRNEIGGKIKIWTAGYSRGGAGVNLSAGRLDEALLGGDSILPSSVTYQKDDIYAYCFEPAVGRSFTEEEGEPLFIKEKDFSNIHCIVNLNDPVPYVAPREFGFARYGVDHYLPDPLTSFDYDRQVSRVKRTLSSLSNSDIVGEYRISSFSKKPSFFSKTPDDPRKPNWTQGRYLQSFLHELAEALGGREGFAKGLEPSLVEIFQVVYKNGAPKDSLIDLGINLGKRVLSLDMDEVLLTDLLHNRGRFLTDFKPLLAASLSNSSLALDVDSFIVLISNVVQALLTMFESQAGFDLFPTLISADNIKSIASGHYPELCLSHLTAMDPNYTSGELSSVSESYYALDIETASPFTLFHDDKEIMSFDGENLTGKMVGELTSYGARIYLPMEGQYRLTLNDDSACASLYEVSGAYNGNVEKKSFDFASSTSFEF